MIHRSKATLKFHAMKTWGLQEGDERRRILNLGTNLNGGESLASYPRRFTSTEDVNLYPYNTGKFCPKIR
jgi:hypothetical protein